MFNIIVVGSSGHAKVVVDIIEREQKFNIVGFCDSFRSVGEGTVVMAGAVVNLNSKVGNFCILNTLSSLDHDSVLGDFASLAPGVRTGGSCRIGKLSAIGIGAVLVHNICVGEEAVIGAGSTVMKDVDSLVVAYGTPAKVIRKRESGERYL